MGGYGHHDRLLSAMLMPMQNSVHYQWHLCSYWSIPTKYSYETALRTSARPRLLVDNHNTPRSTPRLRAGYLAAGPDLSTYSCFPFIIILITIVPLRAFAGRILCSP